MIEEAWLRLDYPETQAFLTPLLDMDSVDLTTLDTLQHRLSGNAQLAHRLEHGEIAIWSLFSNAGAQLVCETNAPWRAWRKLLAGDCAVIDPAMNGRGCDTELGRNLCDGQQFSVGRRSWALETWDIPISA